MDYHARNRKIFGISLLVIEAIIIIFYGFFVRTQVHNDPTNNTNYYPMFQDVNVMILIGFGFLMTYIKHYVWSTLAYTYFINAIVAQLYILWQPFWHKVFEGHWGDKTFLIEKTFTLCSYAAASCLVAFGAVLGRTGPLEMLIMAVVQVIFYTLNEHIVYVEIGAYDVGGSTAIHAFGAYFGVTVSYILSKYARPTHHPESNYSSNIFAYIGTLFLWMFWPSFNAGYFSTTPFEKSTIISNTIISLTGSCLGTFIMTSLVRQKFEVEDVLNASLAGGVIIGAPASLFTNAAASLTIGLFGGILSAVGFRYIGHYLQQKLGIYDSCGVHNLHGMPGIWGGIFGAIAIVSYASDPITDPVKASYLPFYPPAGSDLNSFGRTFYGQGGIQIASIGISVGIAIGAGIIAGFLIRLVYRFTPEEFHNDEIYWGHATDDSEQKIYNPESAQAIKA